LGDESLKGYWKHQGKGVEMSEIEKRRAEQILDVIGNAIQALNKGSFELALATVLPYKEVDGHKISHRYLLEFRYKTLVDESGREYKADGGTMLWLNHEIYAICEALDSVSAELQGIDSIGENRTKGIGADWLQLIIADREKHTRDELR
jgi:hypothetical protein